MMLAKMRTTLVDSIYARAVMLGLVYWLSVVLAIDLVSPIDKIALFWPPNAIVAAALIFSSRKQWPLYLISMALAYFAAIVPASQLPLYVYFGFCAANIIEVLIVAGMVKRFVRAPATHENQTKVLTVAMLASIPAAFISALIGGLFVSSAIEKATFWNASIGWLSSDLSGLFLMLPVLVTWFTPSAHLAKSYKKIELIEVCVIVAIFVAISLFTPIYLAEESQISLIFPYLVFPVLIWTAMRLGIRNTSVAVLAVGMTAIAMTYLGHGPFHIEGLSAFGQVVSMKVGLITITLTTVFLAVIVSDSKRMGGELRESEERLTYVLEGSQQGFWDWNIETGDVQRNDRWAQMLGYSLIDEFNASTDTWTDSIHPDDRDAAWASINDHLEGRSPIHLLEYRMLTKSGEIKWIRDQAKIVKRDDNGRPLRMCGTHTDITERKALEEQLRQSQKMEAVGQLTGGIAHDFNNLLQVSQTNLELLKNEFNVGQETRDILDNAIRAGHKAATLIARLLAFSRKQPLLPKNINVNQLIEGMLSLLERSLGATIEIQTMLGQNLPLVRVDPNVLESAILNLAINARNAMPQGGVLTLQTAERHIDEDRAAEYEDLQPGNFVEVCLTDTGQGMEADVIERAFEPFFTTAEVGEGSGLGLSMVYGFSKQSGGHASLDSEPGKGTTVRVFLPAAEETNISDGE